jgi:hypothetical protein
MSSSRGAAGGAGGSATAGISTAYAGLLAADPDAVERTALVAAMEFFCAKRYYAMIQGRCTGNDAWWYINEALISWAVLADTAHGSSGLGCVHFLTVPPMAACARTRVQS